MKRKRTSILDLDVDVLRHVMICLGKSGDGYTNVARATSVCKDFMELARENDVLKTVFFENSCTSRSDASFWNIDGLISKCARAGNETACHVLLRHVKDQLAFSKIKLAYLDLAVEGFHEKTRAVKAVCTRARSKAAASAWEDVVCMTHDIQMGSCVISQQIEAMEIGTLEWQKALKMK